MGKYRQDKAGLQITLKKVTIKALDEIVKEHNKHNETKITKSQLIEYMIHMFIIENAKKSMEVKKDA